MKAGLTIVIPPMEDLLQNLNHWQVRAMQVLGKHGLVKADFEELLPQRVKPSGTAESALRSLLQLDAESNVADLDAMLHGMSAVRRKKLVQPKKRLPTFLDVDITLGAAKNPAVEWKQYGQYIEFWSAIFCLRMIYQLRFSQGWTEAEWWRAAYEIARRYANMEAARAWAAGMGTKSGKGKPKPSRKMVSDEDVAREFEAAKGNAATAARKLGMTDRAARRRIKKADT